MRGGWYERKSEKGGQEPRHAGLRKSRGVLD